MFSKFSKAIIMSATFPGEVGDRLLPSLVDHIATTDPGRVFCSFAKTKDPADGFQDVTYPVFARAIDRFAWYLEDKLGRGEDFPTLLYMGPQDMLYAIVILGTIKAGYKALLNAPFDSLEANLYLLEETDCHTFLFSKDLDYPMVKRIPENREMRVFEIESLQYWLRDGEVPHYPFTKTFEEAKHEPFAVIHTSGSTSMPKPVVTTHATWISGDMISNMASPVPVAHQLLKSKRAYISFLACHAAGISIMFAVGIYGDITTVMASWPATPEIVNSVITHGNIQAAYIVPSLLTRMFQIPEYVKNLSTLEHVIFAGGTIPESIGDQLSTMTHLVNGFGMTESGIVPTKCCGEKDWKYLQLAEELGHEFRHASDDLYELVIVRHKDPEKCKFQGIFGTYPHFDVYETHDMFSKHPTTEGYWMYRGRSDDMIVLSNGRNINPVDVERTIGSHPIVNGVVVVGMTRPQLALLVEANKPPANQEEKDSLIAELWSTVEAANGPVQSFARIDRDMIVFTSAEKPMSRAGKGTVRRKMTVKLYEEELDRLYEAKEQKVAKGGDIHVNSTLISPWVQ